MKVSLGKRSSREAPERNQRRGRRDSSQKLWKSKEKNSSSAASTNRINDDSFDVFEFHEEDEVERGLMNPTKLTTPSFPPSRIGHKSSVGKRMAEHRKERRQRRKSKEKNPPSEVSTNRINAAADVHKEAATEERGLMNSQKSVTTSLQSHPPPSASRVGKDAAVGDNRREPLREEDEKESGSNLTKVLVTSPTPPSAPGVSRVGKDAAVGDNRRDPLREEDEKERGSHSTKVLATSMPPSAPGTSRVGKGKDATLGDRRDPLREEHRRKRVRNNNPSRNLDAFAEKKRPKKSKKRRLKFIFLDDEDDDGEEELHQDKTRRKSKHATGIHNPRPPHHKSRSSPPPPSTLQAFKNNNEIQKATREIVPENLIDGNAAKQNATKQTVLEVVDLNTAKQEENSNSTAGITGAGESGGNHNMTLENAAHQNRTGEIDKPRAKARGTKQDDGASCAGGGGGGDSTLQTTATTNSTSNARGGIKATDAGDFVYGNTSKRVSAREGADGGLLQHCGTMSGQNNNTERARGFKTSADSGQGPTIEQQQKHYRSKKAPAITIDLFSDSSDDEEDNERAIPALTNPSRNCRPRRRVKEFIEFCSDDESEGNEDGHEIAGTGVEAEATDRRLANSAKGRREAPANQEVLELSSDDESEAGDGKGVGAQANQGNSANNATRDRDRPAKKQSAPLIIQLLCDSSDDEDYEIEAPVRHVRPTKKVRDFIEFCSDDESEADDTHGDVDMESENALTTESPPPRYEEPVAEGDQAGKPVGNATQQDVDAGESFSHNMNCEDAFVQRDPVEELGWDKMEEAVGAGESGTNSTNCKDAVVRSVPSHGRGGKEMVQVTGTSESDTSSTNHEEAVLHRDSPHELGGAGMGHDTGAGEIATNSTDMDDAVMHSNLSHELGGKEMEQVAGAGESDTGSTDCENGAVQQDLSDELVGGKGLGTSESYSNSTNCDDPDADRDLPGKLGGKEMEQDVDAGERCSKTSNCEEAAAGRIMLDKPLWDDMEHDVGASESFSQISNCEEAVACRITLDKPVWDKLEEAVGAGESGTNSTNCKDAVVHSDPSHGCGGEEMVQATGTSESDTSSTNQKEAVLHRDSPHELGGARMEHDTGTGEIATNNTDIDDAVMHRNLSHELGGKEMEQVAGAGESDTGSTDCENGAVHRDPSDGLGGGEGLGASESYSNNTNCDDPDADRDLPGKLGGNEMEQDVDAGERCSKTSNCEEAAAGRIMLDKPLWDDMEHDVGASESFSQISNCEETVARRITLDKPVWDKLEEAVGAGDSCSNNTHREDAGARRISLDERGVDERDHDAGTAVSCPNSTNCEDAVARRVSLEKPGGDETEQDGSTGKGCLSKNDALPHKELEHASKLPNPTVPPSISVPNSAMEAQSYAGSSPSADTPLVSVSSDSSESSVGNDRRSPVESDRSSSTDSPKEGLLGSDTSPAVVGDRGASSDSNRDLSIENDGDFSMKSPSEDNQSTVSEEYTYRERKPVGICERIAKDDKLRVSYETRHQSTTAESFTLAQYKTLWKRVERDEIKWETEVIEDDSDFRGASFSVKASDSNEQGSAIYGRILPKAMGKIFAAMNLRKEHVFVDLGHGIGNACLQASYTIGCRSRGIELVDSRFFVSEAFHRSLAKVTQGMRLKEPKKWDRYSGVVELLHGRLEDHRHRDWLTTDVDRVFVNNFADVFGCRSACRSEVYTIDSKIAALFASLKSGSIMITMHPIDMIGLTRDRVLKHREKHGLDTPVSANASFFKMEELDLGPANETVSWSEGGGHQKMIKMYKYTRLEQSVDSGSSVFLCTNEKDCELATNATPIPAVANIGELCVMNFCKCKKDVVRTREKRKPSRKLLEALGQGQ